MAWLPATSTTVDPALSDMARCAGGGIMRSSVATRYQLGFVRQAGSVTAPPSAPTPHATCASARNAAWAVGRGNAEIARFTFRAALSTSAPSTLPDYQLVLILRAAQHRSPMWTQWMCSLWIGSGRFVE
jgi:hypothetical protein